MDKHAYVAIDDTDNAETRGTGWVARELAELLEEDGLGWSLGVTRHQLLFDRRIPYTSHNSAICIVIEAHKGDVTAIIDEAAAFLTKEAAPGSDAGLCVAEVSQVSPEVIDFGRRAKREVLTVGEARRIAAAAGIHLSGHTGERLGVIGALAAVGLRHTGEDGRFHELNGFRTLEGIQTIEALRTLGICRFSSETGQEVFPQPNELVDLGEGTKAVLQHAAPTLLINKTSRPQAELRWRAVPKERIKQFEQF